MHLALWAHPRLGVATPSVWTALWLHSTEHSTAHELHAHVPELGAEGDAEADDSCIHQVTEGTHT